MVGRRWRRDNSDCRAVVVVASVLIIDPALPEAACRPQRPLFVHPLLYTTIFGRLQSKSLRRKTVYLYKPSDGPLRWEWLSQRLWIIDACNTAWRLVRCRSNLNYKRSVLFTQTHLTVTTMIIGLFSNLEKGKVSHHSQRHEMGRHDYSPQLWRVRLTCCFYQILWRNIALACLRFSS